MDAQRLSSTLDERMPTPALVPLLEGSASSSSTSKEERRAWREQRRAEKRAAKKSATRTCAAASHCAPLIDEADMARRGYCRTPRCLLAAEEGPAIPHELPPAGLSGAAWTIVHDDDGRCTWRRCALPIGCAGSLVAPALGAWPATRFSSVYSVLSCLCGGAVFRRVREAVLLSDRLPSASEREPTLVQHKGCYWLWAAQHKEGADMWRLLDGRSSHSRDMARLRCGDEVRPPTSACACLPTCMHARPLTHSPACDMLRVCPPTRSVPHRASSIARCHHRTGEGCPGGRLRACPRQLGSLLSWVRSWRSKGRDARSGARSGRAGRLAGRARYWACLIAGGH